VCVFFSFYHIKIVNPTTLLSLCSQPNCGRFNLFASNFKTTKTPFFACVVEKTFQILCLILSENLCFHSIRLATLGL
jgi:hypothetical protein